MSRDRQSPTLGLPPEDPARLAGFPARTLSPGEALFRVVRQGRGPWWFGSSMEARFDLHEPEGTCYLAMDGVSALLEVIGPELEGGAISAAFLQTRRLRKLSVPQEHVLGDLTSRAAGHFGITGEIGTVVPYDRPQAWAAKLRAAGLQGLLYWLRHDPARKEGVALFGPHGERKGWRRGREQEISGELLVRLRNECGIEILDVPHSRQLRIVEE